MKKIFLNILKKSKIPLFATSQKTDFCFLAPALKERERQDNRAEWEGEWRKKIHLANTLEGIRSFLVLGFPYPVYFPLLDGAGVSAYAVIRDYHEVILGVLQSLIGHLKDLWPQEVFVPLVDSGKVFEKELALAAGLGFRGRNTLVLHPEYGSYFFIGVILSTAFFPVVTSHPQIPGDCGSCQRCERLCPTGALKDGKLEVKKCIAYMTNHKEKRGYFEGYLWGCDLCQLGCPWNLKRRREPFPGFDYRFSPGLLNPRLSNREFMKKAQGLPLKWGGKKTWVKNLETVFGNRGISGKPVQKEDRCG